MSVNNSEKQFYSDRINVFDLNRGLVKTLLDMLHKRKIENVYVFIGDYMNKNTWLKRT